LTYDEKVLRWIYQCCLKNWRDTYVPGGKRYSSTQAGLSRREASGIVSGREMCVCVCGLLLLLLSSSSSQLKPKGPHTCTDLPAV